ncbi:MAG: flagellar biosynthetic protein FliR [Pseudomonadota bacterium]
MENLLAYTHYGALVMARLAPFFVSSNLSPFARIPASIRIYLLLFFSLFFTLINPPANVLIPELVMFVSALLLEFVLGLLLLFGVQCIFASLSFAGRIVDMQVGFGAAGVIDPATRQTEALIGSLMTSVALVMFFLTDMHHTLLVTINQSLTLIPIGTANFAVSISTLSSAMTTQFVFGILIFLPVIAGLLMIDTLIAFASRTMPQMNVYFVTLPLKIMIGLFLLSISIRYANPVMSDMHNALSVYWQQILGSR